MFRDPSNVPGDVVCSAQALAAAALEAIGKIRTASGSVTVMRADGEIVRVSVGDLVYRGDTIETEADGAVGITFADGTAFDLSAAARLVLNEFVCDPAGTPNSALFSLVQGAFSFVAGKVAKTGGLRIDTPFATIRGSAQDRGIGILTLAALTFAAIKESEAASRHDAFLDDGAITYKDLPHGTFEIVTRDGRVIMADDPGETIVVDPTGSVARLPNSSSRMAELQQAQHSALATFSLGQEGGAAGGSSSPGFDIPVQLQPINFSQPRNDAPTEIVTTHITLASAGFIPVPQQLNPPPPVVTPVLGSAGFSMVTETVNTTGSTHFDTVSSGTLTFTDFEVTTVSATIASMTWSGGATPPSGLAEVLAGALSITTESANPVSGSIATTFSAADRNFDFLAANETLTIVYDVTVTDNQGVSLTRPVTITIIGTNDAPVLAADASGPHAVTEGFNTTGTFAFTDVDLTDHHTVSTSVTSATWSGGATLPSGVAAALAGALSATASDGTGSGSGSIAVTFSAANSAFDFLASGETLTVTYNVTVSDNTGASSTQPVMIIVNGTNDAPVLAVDASGPHTIITALNTTGSTSPDSTSGLLTFTDVDLTDTHQASASAPTFAWSGGTLTVAQQAALAAASTLTLSETDSTGSGSGSVAVTFSAADSAFDFLAAGQTLKITYNVTVSDNTGASSTQPVTIIVNGTNDAPVLAVDASGPHTIIELAGKTGDIADNDTAVGSLSFTDVNLSDTHTVGNSLVAATWSGGATLPSGLSTVLASALTTSVSSDSTGSGSGSVGVTFSAADKTFDFLAAGQTLTITYNVTVADNTGASSTQPVMIIVTGTNDAPVLAVDASGPHTIITALNTTGSTSPDSTSGLLTFTDVDLTDTHQASASAPTFAWSGGTLTAAQQAALAAASTLTLSETDSTGSGSGSVAVTFSAADSAFDFLAAGQTLKITYNVTVSDNTGASSTQPVTIIVNGTNDAPVLAVDASGPHTIIELAGKTGDIADNDTAVGSLSFTDVNLSDTHTVGNSLVAATWSGGATLPSGLSTVLASALTTSVSSDSTGSGSGSVGVTFSAADKTFDFLAAGQTLTITYNVTVADNTGASSTQRVTITVTGTNDAPVLAVDASGPHTITELAGKTGDIADNDTAVGSLSFTDVDLSDTHTVGHSLVAATWSGGATLPSGLSTVLASALTASVSSDSAGSGSGSVAVTFSAADKTFDFLAAGQTLTITYNVTVSDNTGASSTQPVTIIVTGTNDAPVLAVDASGPHTIITALNTTGSTSPDSTSGLLTFTDVDLTDTHQASASAPTFAWSGGTLTAAQQAALAAASTLTLSETDSTGSGSGSVAVTFSAADSAFDFLAAGQTLKITYNVTVSDNTGASSTQPVTIIVNGTNDAPVLAVDASGPHTIIELAGKTGDIADNDTAVGSLSFTDVNLSDTHTVGNSLVAATWSGGATLPSGLSTVLASALTTSVSSDSTGSGSGSVGVTFSAADKTFDFLAAGQTLTITYNVTVADNTGASSTQRVTITVTGTNDAPVLAVDASGPHTITELAGKTGDIADNDTAVGSLSFTDVDLSDTHTVGHSLVAATWSGGATLPSGLSTVLASALTASVSSDSAGSGSGSVAVTFSAADKTFDFLAAGQTLTITYNVTVADNTGASSTQPVMIIVTGTNDAPVLAVDASGPHTIITALNTTGSTSPDSTSGLLTFTDVDLTDTHQASASAPTFAWSGGTLTAAQQAALAAASTLTLSETDSTGSGSGSVAVTFSAADSAFDFLAAGQTLKITYNVTVSDNTGASSTQPVTIIVNGTNDAPVLAVDASGPHTIIELAGKTGDIADNDTAVGSLSFTDVNLSDTHTVGNSLVAATWSGGATLPSGLSTVLASALTTSVSSDSTGSGSGSVGVTFSAADKTFDFLAAGQTLTITYNVTVADNTGASSTQRVTITVTGTNDAPVLAVDASGPHTITELAGKTGDIADNDTAVGSLSFTDVDLSDTHTVGHSLVAATWSGGATLPSGLSTVLASALTASVSSDSAGSGSGSVAVTFSAADKTFDFLAAGQTLTITYNVTVADNTGASSTQPVTITVTGTNDAPVITSGSAAVAVSEEGLPNGVPDTLPAIIDTTNSPIANGTITASDADGDPLTMTLGAPNTPLTSGGATIAWTFQNGGHTLVGKAGATTIITATITDAGAYTVTLTGPIDHPLANQEDNKTFAVPVTVSDGHTTTPTTLSVTIEDDSPKAEPVEVSVVPTDSKTNVMLILDLSGSMASSSGLTGLTRLDVEKAAVNEVLDQYDNRGDVMVRIVTFSDTGAAVGSAWQSVANAKAAIAGLSAGGSTNYDAALPAAMGAFTDGTKLTGPGTQNVSYFLSDGDPTAGHGVNQTEQQNWESFLKTNNIVSFALGISDVAPQTANLDPIAFDPASGLQLADTPIRVTDLGQLANALVFTIPPVTGSVLTGAGGATSNSFGADGGFVQSITVDGVTYTFNPAANGGAGGITTSGSFTYDGTTKTLTVDTDTSVVGGELAMVMTTGAFTFHPPTGFSSESVDFVLVDRDGDTASSTIHFSAAGGPDHPPIVRDDHVITNISGGSGTNIVIPDYALLYNDGDTDGQTIAITGAITNVLGASSVTHASGNVTFTDNNTNGGSFTYTGSTTSPVASDTGDVTIDRSQTGTTLTGTGFGEILIGRDGTNNTINANEGNDVLIGGTGNDTLNGGAGADMMIGGGGIDTFIINSAQSPGTIGGSGDAGTISGYDVITDFATATDILNLQGTAAPATGTNVNGTDSSLTINGQTIKSHTISNGIITFDDANTFGSPLTLSSTADVAAAVDYLHRNNLGNAGATVAFVANIGGTAHSYVFEQVGNSPNAANDILVDLAGVTLSNLTALIPSHILPAGVSGSPMNLGLTDPAGDVGSVTVAIAGVPSGWTLSEGTNNGDGSWTIQASCVSMLSITSPANYAGAMALQVTMSWTNADGSNGFARATDNVEVFAQGAPIFAWSGEDHLTGSSGKDLFVFAQPIGHDTIYSFNASEDQIDLIGYWGLTNFNDVQHHLSQDSASNAVITLANGQSITLLDVPGSSLSANNFVFDHTPALINTGTLTISDGALLPLSGIITNTGTIALDSTGNEAHLELIQNGITLQGGGQVVLSDSDENLISGTAPSVTLTNMDNTISGAGQLGTGQMALINNGTIAAIGTHALVVDTGTNVLTNAGTLEATGSGGLIVNSDVANSGLIWANGGNITINGAVTGSGSGMISGAATLELGAESSANVTFGADAAGTLILRDPTGFTGTISGLSSADHIDLANISYETASLYGITYSSNTNITTLVITGETNTDTINLLGNYTINTAWHFSDDGHGGTIVLDVPVSAASYLTSVQSTSADNNLLFSSPLTAANDNGDGQTNVSSATADGTVAALKTAVSDPDGSETTNVTVNGNGAVSPGDMNDQFHFAYTNPDTFQSTELPGQAASHPAGEIPASTTDNSGVGHGNDFNAAALPDAVEDAKGSDKAQIRGAAAKDLSTTDVAGATVVGHNDSSSFQGALSGEMNDQFHFANPNLGNEGLGQQSLELPNQATSHPAVEIPPATTELAQIVDDVLTQAAQAALDPGTTPDHNSQLPWTNTDQHNRSGDFITHA